MRNLIFCVFVAFALCGCVNKKISSSEVMPTFLAQKNFDFGVNVVAVGVEQTHLGFAYITNYELKKAIENSIKKSNLFKFVGGSDATLEAFLIYYSYPYVGLTFDARVEIAWNLKRNNEILYRKSFVTYVDQTNSDFSALSRLRSAVVEAIKQNIYLALTDISRQNF